MRHVEKIGKGISRTVAVEIASVKRAAILRGEAGISRKKKDIVFEKASEAFLSWIEVNRKRGTLTDYEQRLGQLAKAFGGKRLGQIRADELERYKQSRVRGERGKVSVNRELAILSSMINRCRKLGLSEVDNPVPKAARFRESSGRIRFLEWEEEARLLAAAAEPLRTIILCGSDAGLRLESEALSLRWSGIDFRRELVTVDAAYAKNSEIRSIPMTARLKQALLAHRFRAGKQDADGLVFQNRRRRPLRSIRNVFEAARKAAGLGQDVTPHVCRHTFASRLVMAGVDIATVKELMGHKRIEMTMRYAHLSPKHRARAVALLVPPESFPDSFHNMPSATSSATG
jgi:integrase